MTTLAKNTVRQYGEGPKKRLDPEVIASDIIYQGAAVGDNGSGYARPLEAGDPFRGFADEKVDNSAGSAGDKRVACWSEGYVWLTVTGIDGLDDVGKPVYASDDDTFTNTRSGNSYIGESVDYNATDGVLVQFCANEPVAAIADAVTSHALNATFDDTEVEADLDALGTKVNAIIDALEQKGVIVPS